MVYTSLKYGQGSENNMLSCDYCLAFNLSINSLTLKILTFKVKTLWVKSKISLKAVLCSSQTEVCHNSPIEWHQNTCINNFWNVSNITQCLPFIVYFLIIYILAVAH